MYWYGYILLLLKKAHILRMLYMQQVDRADKAVWGTNNKFIGEVLFI